MKNTRWQFFILIDAISIFDAKNINKKKIKYDTIKRKTEEENSISLSPWSLCKLFDLIRVIDCPDIDEKVKTWEQVI